MRTIKGPGLFLAQFATDKPPHNCSPLDRAMGQGLRI